MESLIERLRKNLDAKVAELENESIFLRQVAEVAEGCAYAEDRCEVLEAELDRLQSAIQTMLQCPLTRLDRKAASIEGALPVDIVQSLKRQATDCDED